ncbi:DUF1456 family protein [Flavobacterium bizetiae]|uniref:DUF1456 family protein n=1 Tax=Flavobacterium bizetiae TaxID=2704140 RepID=UPI0021E76A08|nr:DUF1456 family protein [Flavobacterium bizetiae]UTN06431.1 DUF1456 family protein [Flavobacterium bizetiae]
MTNNDILKKLRVALMLRDDQIVEILELVDFRISKSELGAFFRAEDHENYMECGDQVLRNFLNGLVIHLRGTKENPKNPNDVLAKHKAEIPKKDNTKERPEFKATTKDAERRRGDKAPSKSGSAAGKPKKKEFPKGNGKISVVEKVVYKNGKNKK